MVSLAIMAAQDCGLVSRSAHSHLLAFLFAFISLFRTLSYSSSINSPPSPKLNVSSPSPRVESASGSSLADALTAHRDVFSDPFPSIIGMVLAGEQHQRSEALFDRLAEYKRSPIELCHQGSERPHLSVILLCVGTAIMAFRWHTWVPQVATIFEQQHAALPLATKILIAFFSRDGDYYWLSDRGFAAGRAGRRITGAMADSAAARHYRFFAL